LIKRDRERRRYIIYVETRGTSKGREETPRRRKKKI
jgi:hypothetical protein